MPTYEAASGYVQLIPSAQGFGQKAESDLKRIPLNKEVDLDLDAARLEAGLSEARAKLEALQKVKTDPRIDADITAANARIKEINARLTELGKKESSPKVDADIAQLRAKLVRAESELEQLQQKRADPQVGADIKVLQAKIRQSEQELSRLNRERAEPHVGADTSRAEAQMAKVRGQLDQLRRITATPRVDAQISGAESKMLRIRAELDRLAAMRPSPKVDADIASATAKLQVISAQLSVLGGRRTDVNISSGNLPSIPPILMAIVAGLAAIASAAGPAAAALAALPAALSGAAQGVAALMAGFSGVSEAISGVESAQKAAGSAGASAGKQQESAARGVESAARAVQQAQIQQARTAIQGAQQVAAAERALEAARIQAARVAIQSAQQIAAAQRALAQAQIQAARSIADAEQGYTRALQQEKYAQEDLTRARKDAQRALADLQLQTSGAALSQERAQINLQRAQQALAAAEAAGLPDGLDKQELVLSVKEAEQAVKETQNSYKNLTEDSAEWARTGIEGSQGVVAAQRSLLAAQEAVRDSAVQLSRAQADGARSVQEAQIALAQTVQQAGWAQQDAARGVQDAEIALSQARQQAAWANEDAARAVADAQRALSDAYKQAGETGAASVDKVAEALKGLPQAAKDFVLFWVNEFKPRMSEISDAVATQMLPRITTALRNLYPLIPIFRDGLAETGRVIGDLAIKGSEMMTSGPWREDFKTIMASNNRTLELFGNAGLQVADAFRSIIVASQPLVERFARAVKAGAELFNQWIQGKRQTGELTSWFNRMGDRLAALWGVLKDTAKWAYDLGVKLAPVGDALIAMLPVVRDVGTALVDGLVAGFKTLQPILTPIVEGIGALARWFSSLPEPVQGSIVAFLLFGLGALKLITTTVKVIEAVRGISTAFTVASAAVKLFASRQWTEGLATLVGPAQKAGQNAGQALEGGFVTGSKNTASKAGEVGGAAATAAQQGWLSRFARTAAGAGLIVLAIDTVDKMTGQPVSSMLGPGNGGFFDKTMSNIDLLMGAVNQKFTGEPLSPAQQAWAKEWEKMDRPPSAALLQVQEAIRTGLIPIPPEVQAGGQQAVERFTGALAAMPEGARNTMEGVKRATQEALNPGLGDIAQLSAQEATRRLTDNLFPGNGQDVRIKGEGLAGVLGQGLNSLGPTAGGKGAEATKAMSDALAPIGPNSYRQTAEATRGAGQALSGMPGIAGNAGTGATSSMFGGLAAMAGNTQNQAQATTTGFGQGIDPLARSAGTAGTEATRGMGQSLSPLPGNTQRVGGDTVNAFNTGIRPLSGQAQAGGQSAMQSFWNGLQSVWSSLWSWVQSMFNSLGNLFNSQMAAYNAAAPGPRGMAAGGLLTPMANGGLLKEQPMIANASGNRLKPMNGSYAQVIPPNTWRVIGDNLSVPELFAPLNGSRRTAGLLAEAAAHEGFALVSRSVADAMARAANGGGGDDEERRPVGKYALGQVVSPTPTVNVTALPRYDNAAPAATSGANSENGSQRGATPMALVGEYHSHFHGDNQEGVAVRDLTHALRVIGRGGGKP